MQAVSKVLVASPYDVHHRERLVRIFAPADVIFVDRRDRRGLASALKGSQVAILKGTPSHGMLAEPEIRWIHCNQSGLDRCATPDFLKSGIAITSAAGRSAPVLAEHAIFFMLCHAYRATDQWRAQRRRTWRFRGMGPMRGLAGCRTLVVGMGHTARALVPRLQALEMEVVAFRRNAEHENEFGIPIRSLDAGDSLDDVLPEADFVVLAASLNNSSYRMIGDNQFRAMKPGACLVNVARAQLVDKSAMLSALQHWKLGGAGVDVTEPEPLPPWASLWRYPNVIITPHVTPQVADRSGREIDIIAANWSRLQAGMTLRNKLSERDAFDYFEAPDYSRIQRMIWHLWDRVMRPAAKYR